MDLLLRQVQERLQEQELISDNLIETFVICHTNSENSSLSHIELANPMPAVFWPTNHVLHAIYRYANSIA